MTEIEIRAVLTTAAEVLMSRSRFCQFAVDLSEKLFGTIGLSAIDDPNDENVLVERPDEVQEQFEAYWRVVAILRATFNKRSDD